MTGGLSECQEESILIPMTRISCIKAGTDTHYGGLELLLFVGGQCSIQRPSNIRLTAAYQSLKVKMYFQELRIFFQF